MKLKNFKPIAVLGNPHTGKTNLCAFLAEKSGFETKYILGYPAKIDGYINLNDLRDLSRISECVLVIDEIDELIPIYDKKSNEALKRLLKFCYHNKIKLIFNTQLSQFISKMMSALVPCWAMTEIDIFELKNGSKPKRILLDYIKLPKIINKEIGMRLELGNFVWYNDYAEAGENGLYQFKDMNLDKAWGNNDKDTVKKIVKAVKNANETPK